METNAESILFQNSSNTITPGVILKGYLLLPICLIGIAGNILLIIVLNKFKINCSLSLILKTLAFVDITHLAIQFFAPGIQQVSRNPKFLEFGSFHAQPLFFYISNVGENCSIYLTLFVTIERYIAITKPLKADKILTLGLTKWMICTIVIFSILFSLPSLFIYFWPTILEDTAKYFILPSPDESKLLLFMYVYQCWIILICQLIIPLVGTSVLNYRIWIEVREMDRKRQQISSKVQARATEITKLLILAVLTFGICYVGKLVCAILTLIPVTVVINGTKIVIPSYYCRVADALCYSIYILFPVINEASNFYIYCFAGKGFRRAFIQMIMGKSKGTSGPTSTPPQP